MIVPPTLFKYCSSATGRIVLMSHSFRWSSPLVFNDIFDVERQFDVTWDWDELRSEAIAEYLRVFKSDIALVDNSESRMLAYYRELYRGYPDSFLIENLSRKVDTLLNQERHRLLMGKMRWNLALATSRIFCAAERANNILMWAHYAESFRGLVIEFDPVLFHDFADDWRGFRPVRYVDRKERGLSKEQLIKIWTCQAPADYDIHYRVLNKFDVWSYEQEWRANRAAPTSEELSKRTTDFPFDKRCIKTVFLGAAMEESVQNELVNLISLEYPWCRVVRVNAAQHEYELLFTDLVTPSQQPTKSQADAGSSSEKVPR